MENQFIISIKYHPCTPAKGERIYKWYNKETFTGVTLSALWADTLLRNEGNGLPHQCAHWLAMTVVFDTFRT